MGIFFSSSRTRRDHNYFHNPSPPSSQLISSSSYSYPSSDPYTTPPYRFPALPPTPSPPPPPPPLYGATHYSSGYNSSSYANPLMVPPNFGPFYAYGGSGWVPIRPPALQPPPPPLPVYVEHQQAKKVKNDVNVHKGTLTVEVDEENPDHHLVSFVFDALYDGSFTIYYFATEEPECKFAPIYPEAYKPVKVPFLQGPGQKFRQPSGTGIDLGFFELDNLMKPSPGEQMFPLVIVAETCPPLISMDNGDPPPTNIAPHTQITQAVLEKRNEEDPFMVRVIRQLLWIDGVRYELREIYGINSGENYSDDGDSGKECIICLSEPKDTAVLPCRHLCMCSECAKALRLQSNNCPVCRQPIEELMEIKINNAD